MIKVCKEPDFFTPWHEGGNEYAHGIVDAEGFFVCTMPDKEKYGMRYRDVNAELLKRAPELLEALRTVVSMEYDRDDESRNFDNERLEAWQALIDACLSRKAVQHG